MTERVGGLRLETGRTRGACRSGRPPEPGGGRRVARHAAWLWALLAVLVPVAAAAAECRATRGGPVPRVVPELESAAFWLARYGRDADRVLLGPAALRALDARVADQRARPTDVTAAEGGPTRQDARDRLAAYTLDVARGALVPPGDALLEASRVIEAAEPAEAVRVVAREAHLRCVPTDVGFFKPPVDPDFDRNQCSGLHFGEPVREVGRSGAWSHVRTESGSGWVHSADLGPALAPGEAAAYGRGAQGAARVMVADDGRFRLGTRFPAAPGGVRVPTLSGAEVVPAPARSRTGPLPFTRRSLFDAAFSELGEPYGWGDVNGHRDCSRLILDVFAAAGLGLGRNSGTQAMVGSEVIAVAGLDDVAKRRAIVAAGARGALLLYMPGHIMLYLGERDGQPWALSALSEYVEPCADGSEVIHRVGRVTVSDLELGRGTSRTAFIERITALVLFGEATP